MATNDRQAREERARLRTYRARQEVHAGKQRRRVRDNWIAGIGLIVVLTLATIAQIIYIDGPGGADSSSATPSATDTPSTDAAGQNQGDVPSVELAEERTWSGTLTFNDTLELGIELDGAAAPQAVASEIALAQANFYDGTACHRLTTEGLFVLQCGDPDGTGAGGPGYSYGPVENAPSDGLYPAGTLAMARQSGDGYSNGSQFFIVYEDTTLPDDSAGGYTVIGHVTSGLDELTTAITDAGTADGSSDGAPAAPATISSFVVE